MTINIGDKFPDSTLCFYQNNSIKNIGTNQILKNKNIIIFGMPGAFTPTCSKYHIPSIIKQIDKFKKKGVDDIFCLVVNDIYVAKVWADHTGATESGLKVVSDPCGTLVKKIGMSFNVPDIGFVNRSIRFCIILKNGFVEQIFTENKSSGCDITSGRNILSQLEL